MEPPQKTSIDAPIVAAFRTPLFVPLFVRLFARGAGVC